MFRVDAINAAVGPNRGELEFQEPDYRKPASFGSLELRQTAGSENIGQPLEEHRTRRVPMLPMSELSTTPPDFIKIDIEGMEAEVMVAAEDFVAEHQPIIFCEHIKADRQMLFECFSRIGYRVGVSGINLLAMPEGDSLWDRVSVAKVGS